jgi:mRNA interferase MazF
VGLRRGDVITVALQGDLGKPRPALIVETDSLEPTGHVLVCPGTSHIVPEAINRRIVVEPDAANGLRETTQFQIDKLSPARRDRCGAVIGRLDAGTMAQIGARMILVLGLAE